MAFPRGDENWQTPTVQTAKWFDNNAKMVKTMVKTSKDGTLVKLRLVFSDAKNQPTDNVPDFLQVLATKFRVGVGNVQKRANAAAQGASDAEARRVVDMYTKVVAQAWSQTVVRLVAMIANKIRPLRNAQLFRELVRKCDEQIAILFAVSLTGNYVS